jgi:tRNA dimethylallyltransferase
MLVAKKKVSLMRIRPCSDCFMSKKVVIQIAGPTAVGKTALAIELAKWLGTEIISFDSRQCYQELVIGVARPGQTALTTVPHHFIASHSITENVDAAVFATYANQVLAELFKTKSVVVMVGGTGLYWKAFYEGLDQIPAVDPALRTQLTAAYQQKGIAWLQQALQQEDPNFAAQGEMKNPQRLLRALEVVRTTGQSILSFRTAQVRQPDFDLLPLGLKMERAMLVGRINQRVDVMLQEGLIQEVEALQHFANYNALQTVGYQEIFAYLQKNLTLNQAIEQIKINTRQYAKRQMTWFQKQTSLNWFEPDQFGAIQSFIQSKLA